MQEKLKEGETPGQGGKATPDLLSGTGEVSRGGEEEGKKGTGATAQSSPYERRLLGKKETQKLFAHRDGGIFKVFGEGKRGGKGKGSLFG